MRLVSVTNSNAQITAGVQKYYIKLDKPSWRKLSWWVDLSHQIKHPFSFVFPPPESGPVACKGIQNINSPPAGSLTPTHPAHCPSLALGTRSLLLCSPLHHLPTPLFLRYTRLVLSFKSSAQGPESVAIRPGKGRRSRPLLLGAFWFRRGLGWCVSCGSLWVFAIS
jgi:hypothetical protein